MRGEMALAEEGRQTGKILNSLAAETIGHVQAQVGAYRAALAQVESGGQHPFEHPFHWAAFAVYGTSEIPVTSRFPRFSSWSDIFFSGGRKSVAA